VADLQPRDVTRVKRLIADATDPIETDVAMIITSDSRSPAKLRDWSVDRSHGLIVIPLSRDRLEELFTLGLTDSILPSLIGKWISAYNLYDQREPVTGERFFGRADLLRDLDRKLAQGSGHVGLFGLRRIGKTSLLLELKERLRKRSDVVPIFLDLERSLAVGHVAFRLGDELAQVLEARSELSARGARRALHLPEDWREVPTETLLSNIGDSLKSLLEAGALSASRLVLILDEAEIILPSVDEPRENAVDLLRVLRGVAQETGQLTIVLAGVNASPSESPLLGVEDNPLFGLLSVEYLGPLTERECAEMVRLVGRKMQVRWDEAPLTSLTREVGAHPLLARLAASDIVSSTTEPLSRPNTGHVEAALSEFPVRHGPIFEQMVHSLRRYYPEEFEFLRIVAAGDQAFVREYADAHSTTLNHLVGYGVLHPTTLSLRIPVFARWLRMTQR
jgi:serine/threonine-protein kinase